MAVICGAKHKIEDVAQLLDRLANISKTMGRNIQLLNASMIFGKEHLEVAVEKAERAFSAGRNIANSLANELLLYAGVERQVSTAIEKMGIRQGLDEIAIVVFGEADIDLIINELGWIRDDTVLEPDLSKLEEFGIDISEKDDYQDLILEKMALSELVR